MQNINPTSIQNRRTLYYRWVYGAPVIAISLLGLAMAALTSQLPLFGGINTIMMIGLIFFSVIAFILGVGFFYRSFTLTHDNEIAYTVGEILRQSIGADPRYSYIRSISRRNLGYVDAVLVGPPGALVFRVVDATGTWRNERADWKIINPRNGKFQSAPYNPSKECARDVYALRKFLSKRRLDKVPVYGVVVFTNPEAVLQAQGPVVPVTKTNRLYEIISRDYLKEERINISQIEATVDNLIEG